MNEPRQEWSFLTRLRREHLDGSHPWVRTAFDGYVL